MAIGVQVPACHTPSRDKTEEKRRRQGTGEDKLRRGEVADMRVLKEEKREMKRGRRR